jgi:hypothetical protein
LNNDLLPILGNSAPAKFACVEQLQPDQTSKQDEAGKNQRQA